MVILHSDPLPLRVDESGTIRVGASRITLDVVIADYQKGMSAEEIVRELDSLTPADVHGAIAYYLRHREEVDAYLQARRCEADELRKKIEANTPDREQLRAKLESRLGPKGTPS